MKNIFLFIITMVSTFVEFLYKSLEEGKPLLTFYLRIDFISLFNLLYDTSPG